VVEPRPDRIGIASVTMLESSISAIDADGLRYRGISVAELCEHASYEEVAWLLWTGSAPSVAEREALRAEIASGTSLPAEVTALLSRFPAAAAPVARLQAALPLLALTVPALSDASDRPLVERAAVLMGAFAMLAGGAQAVGARAAGGLAATNGSVAELFLNAARIERATPDQIRAFEQVLILYADHELNASTFAGRVAASTRADLVSAVLAALCTLRGPLHGGVDRYVRAMLAAAEHEGAEGTVDRYLRGGGVLPGFGHAVYRGIDPRAVIMRDLAHRLAPAAGQSALLTLTEAIMAAAAQRGLHANVDLYTVAVYRSLSIPDRLSTLVFATGRLAGWCAHIMEQYTDNRLIRPRAAYIGPGPRRWRSAS